MRDINIMIIELRRTRALLYIVANHSDDNIARVSIHSDTHHDSGSITLVQLGLRQSNQLFQLVNYE